MEQQTIAYTKTELVKDFFNYLIEIAPKYNEKPLSHLMDIKVRFDTFVTNAPFVRPFELDFDPDYSYKQELGYFWDQKIPIFSSLSSIDDDVMAYLKQLSSKKEITESDIGQFCNLSVKKSIMRSSKQEFVDRSAEFMDILETYVTGNISRETISFVIDAYHDYIDKRVPADRIEKEKILSKLDNQVIDPYDVLYNTYGALVDVFENFYIGGTPVFENDTYDRWADRFIELQKKLDSTSSEGSKKRGKQKEKQEASNIDNITFDDVVGLESAKNVVIRKLIIPYKHPGLEKELGENTANLLVLYGPPGTGKTTFARAISTEIDAIYEEVGTIHKKHVGESQKNFDSIVDSAHERMMAEGKNVVLYLDEITQSFDPEREYDRILIDKFKSILSDRKKLTHITDEGKKVQIYFIGSTNHIDQLDSSLIRHERAVALEIPLPDTVNRKKIWEKKLEGKNIGKIDYAGIAKQTEGLSGADIVAMIEEDKYLAGMRLKPILCGKELHQLSDDELRNIDPNDARMRITHNMLKKAVLQYMADNNPTDQKGPEGMFG